MFVFSVFLNVSRIVMYIRQHPLFRCLKILLLCSHQRKKRKISTMTINELFARVLYDPSVTQTNKEHNNSFSPRKERKLT
ncbi:hypothetical protein L6452_20060 [Arctium lappa]|uniref:Uncharacterized protein n=1 Tax=Arctium lappa TaxID=4217 RepID=A0ACB9BAB8_ARCLA|nr:hypothetical protein L6452_20060 [Arctium lappa]